MWYVGEKGGEVSSYNITPMQLSIFYTQLPFLLWGERRLLYLVFFSDRILHHYNFRVPTQSGLRFVGNMVKRKNITFVYLDWTTCALSIYIKLLLQRHSGWKVVHVHYTHSHMRLHMPSLLKMSQTGQDISLCVITVILLQKIIY